MGMLKSFLFKKEASLSKTYKFKYPLGATVKDTSGKLFGVRGHIITPFGQTYSLVDRNSGRIFSGSEKDFSFAEPEQSGKEWVVKYPPRTPVSYPPIGRFTLNGTVIAIEIWDEYDGVYKYHIDGSHLFWREDELAPVGEA
jgi:hypothetical protein